MRVRALICAVCVAAGLSLVRGQEPSFDVVSVKVNTSGDPVSRMSAPAGTGRFEATNTGVRMLILNAYGIPDFQLVGGPSWIDSVHVDVTGIGPATATRDDIARMTRTLLAQRFNLVVHREQRQMPVYSLVVARADGRLGPGIQAATTNCAAATTKGAPAPQLPSGQLLCTTRMSPTTINAGGMTMARLAQQLSGVVGRVVTDETKLAGTYDLQLSFAPERALPPGAPPADPNLPSIFAALQEQLGLKLDATRGMVDVLVIDRIDPPKEN